MDMKLLRLGFFLILNLGDCTFSTSSAKGNSAQNAAKPRPCRYETTNQGLKADCSRRGLKSIPANLTEDVRILDFGDNNLTSLTNESFRSLPQLMYLYLPSNNISTIEVGSFSSLPDLDNIVLRSNNLTSLPRDVFSRNDKLRSVDLSNNWLTIIPGDIFQSVETLQFLDLTSNRIKNLNFTWIRSRKMSTLSLTHNMISSLHEDDFLPLKDTKMDQFVLSHNNISYLPDNVFKHLEGVNTLRLTNNHIGNFSVNSFVGMRALQKLDIAANNISAIIPFHDSFNNSLVLPPLISLGMQGNRIYSLPSGAFRGLDKLVTLDIHQCRIKNLQEDSFEGLTSLEKLDLSGNFLSYLTKQMFSFCPRLRELYLSRNVKLKTFYPNQLGSINTLTNLSIARCAITDIVREQGGWDLPSLESLDISNNRIIRVNKNSFYGMTNLTFLDMSNNPITTIENNAFATNDYLHELRLSSLGSLGSIISPFTNLNLLSVLYLSDTAVALKQELFVGLSNLQRLYMRRSQLDADSFWDPHSHVPVLSSLSTLKRLYLQGNKLDRLRPGTFQGLWNLENLEMVSCGVASLDKAIFRNLTSLLYIYIDENQIKELTQEHLFDLTSLVGLSVNNNGIKELDVDMFARNPRLSFIYISHNSLTTIKEDTILPRKLLDISYNPLSCTCELEWFVKWLDEARATVNHLDQTNCSLSSLPQFRNKPILTFHPESVCGPDIALYVVTSMVIFICAVLCIVAYRKRWWLNYKCFHLKLLVVGYEEVEDGREREDYEYDINLMFDDRDEDWVRSTLRPELQERLPDFNRIMCGDNELPLGMYYINAIIEVIENSFKTILVVSEHVVDNHPFANKLRLAVEHMNEVELEKVILIFKDDLPDNRLPYLVRLFLSRNKPYFLWSDDFYGQRLMWERLVKDLCHNKRMNDVLPV